jgi:vacuolar-type H+-ATPase subunit D/Vma8
MCSKHAPFELPPRAPAEAVEFASAPLPEPTIEIPVRPRRRKLWELGSSYHCPIIGTCLSVAELRKAAKRARVRDVDTYTDYELHVSAVRETQKRSRLAEQVHKMLEDKYRLVIARFARLANDDERLRCWREHAERGEVAGMFWAIMSAGDADQHLIDQAYMDVHMLSHQVGAGQRADLRRLAAATRENDELRQRLARIQARHKTDLAVKQERHAALQRHLSEIRGEAAELRRRLQSHMPHPTPALSELQAALARARAAHDRDIARADRAEAEAASLRAALAQAREQLEVAEQALASLLAADPRDCPAREGETCALPDMGGRCVLCVGGQVSLADGYQALIERCNGRFAYHDGGLEHRTQRLHALLARADAVIVPADHVSHSAYYEVKRTCKQLGKPCVMLPNSGLTSLARGLHMLATMAGEGGAVMPLAPHAPGA